MPSNVNKELDRGMSRIVEDISEELELAELLRQQSEEHDCIDADCDYNLKGEALYVMNPDGTRKKGPKGKPIRTQVKPTRATEWNDRIRRLWRKYRDKPPL